MIVDPNPTPRWASYVNGVLLLGAAAWIFWTGWNEGPQVVEALGLSAVLLVGLTISFLALLPITAAVCVGLVILPRGVVSDAAIRRAAWLFLVVLAGVYVASGLLWAFRLDVLVPPAVIAALCIATRLEKWYRARRARK